MAALLATVTAGFAAPAVGAAPDRPSRLCSELWNDGPGAVSGITVEGDLVVDDPGAGCTLSQVWVLGDLVVPAGVGVVGAGVDIEGNVRAAGSLALGGRAGGVSVAGDVLLDGGPDTRTELSVVHLRGDVRGRTGDLLLDQGSVYGTYDVTVAHVTRLRGLPPTALDTIDFSGSVTVRGGRLLVHDAGFEDGLTVEDAGDVLICRARIEQDLLITRLTDYARIGVEGPHRCDTSIDGSLVLVDSPHSIDLGILGVSRHLVCDDNTGPRGITRTDRTQIFGAEHGSCA